MQYEKLTLFFEEHHPQIFEMDAELVENAEHQLNRLYQAKGYATLNDFYFLLGFPYIEDGDNIGWQDFGAQGPERINFIHSVESISTDISERDASVEMYVLKISYDPKPFHFDVPIQQYRREYYGRKEQ